MLRPSRIDAPLFPKMIEFSTVATEGAEAGMKIPPAVGEELFVRVDPSMARVTLFALIFVTGIVIDDSIIVAENMERHFRMKDRPLRAAARAAVDERRMTVFIIFIRLSAI